MDIKDLLYAAIDLAAEAGRAVLEVYGSEDFGVSIKDDRSPLTLADRRSHEIISRGLAGAAPGIPVISEEGSGVPYATRRGWKDFFLVDPLDGTKEFINRNGEFTVNIALIRGGRPVMGVIYVPVKDTMYYASSGGGAFRRRGREDAEPIGVRALPHANGGLTVVASRSHGSEALEAFLSGVRVVDRISAGSSLKFCLVAEGSADIYPRFGPTWEWDTAAGHAIVSEAGGVVSDTAGNADILYNKEVLKHPGFIAWGALRPSGLDGFRQ